MSALVIHPEIPSTLYAATVTGLFKTTDGGENWASAGNGLPPLRQFSRLAMDPTAPATLYVGTLGTGSADPNPSSVYKTTNAGGQWAAAGTGLPYARDISALVVDPSSSSTVYAGVNGGGIFRTTDGGANWTVVNAGLTSLWVTSLTLAPTSPTTLYAGTDGVGVFKSLDRGATWHAVNSGLPTVGHRPMEVGALALHPASPATLYVGVQEGVFKSLDAGETWVDTGSPVSNPSVLVVAPSAPDTIYVGSLSRLFASTNGGARWDAADDGLPAPPLIQAIAVHPTVSSTLYAGLGWGLGVFKGDGGGLTWTPRNRGLRYLALSVAVDPAMPTTLYTEAGYARVFKSQDAGTSWTAMRHGLDGQVLSNGLLIDPAMPATIYAAMDVTLPGPGLFNLFKSDDGAASWRSVYGPTDSGVVSVAVDPGLPSTLYAATYGSGMVKTLDGGEHWTPSGNGLPRILTHVATAPWSPPTVYALASAGDRVFRSVDGGATWTAASRGLPPSSAAFRLLIDPALPGTVYALLGPAGVFRSRDGGESWASVLENPFVLSLAIDQLVPGRLFAATWQDGGVLVSEDDGETWIAMNAGLSPANVATLALTPGWPATLYAGTSTGVFELRLPVFTDVRVTDPYWPWIEALYDAGLTQGCASGLPPRYCPDGVVSRAQMAVFLLRGIGGAGATPPAPTGTVFTDVPPEAFAAAWIEQLGRLGITAGCGNGKYCPGAAATRGQAALLLLRSRHGTSFAPPPATGTRFLDVPADHPFGAWIEQLAREGITGGCAEAHFCPDRPVSRRDIAVFLVLGFDLPH